MTSAASASRPPGRRPRRFPIAGGIVRALAVCAMAAACPAQAHAGEDDLQFWPTFTVYSPTVNGWRGSGEVHMRWTDDLSAFERAVFRVNGGRLFDNGIELFGGYEKTEPGTWRIRSEHRVWEQIEYTVRRGTWSLAHRARLEERFVDDAPGTGYRIRFRFRAQRAIGRGWQIGVGEELWFQLNSVLHIGTKGFDQNRVTLTAARRLSQHLSIEPGYLHIYGNEHPPEPNDVAHAITLQVTARF